MSKQEKKRLAKNLRNACFEYFTFVNKNKKAKVVKEEEEEEVEPAVVAVKKEKKEATEPKKAKTFEDVKATCESKNWDLNALNKDELKVVIKYHNAKDKKKRILGGKKEELVNLCNEIDDLWE